MDGGGVMDRKLLGPISKLLAVDATGTARMEILEEVIRRCEAIALMFEADGWRHYFAELADTAQIGDDILDRHDLYQPDGQREIIAELQFKQGLLATVEWTRTHIANLLEGAQQEYQALSAGRELATSHLQELGGK